MSNNPDSGKAPRSLSGKTSRPPSRTSHNRPPSVTSIRTSSQQRPVSRHSQSAPRQMSHLLSLCQILVSQVCGLTNQNDGKFKAAVDFAYKRLDHPLKPAPSSSMDVIDGRFAAHVLKSRIHSRDAIAEALDMAYKRIKARARADDSCNMIRVSHLPDHLQTLLALSLPVSLSTITFAEDYLQTLRNRPTPNPDVTWKDILAEEPFSGQHWEGVYGLPPGSTVEEWETHSEGSSLSLSPVEGCRSGDLKSASNSSLDDARPPCPLAVAQSRITSPEAEPHVFYHRELLEDLQARQYWRQEWRSDASVLRPFYLGDASTLGPSFSMALKTTAAARICAPGNEHYINESDAVREILLALQGRKNILLDWMSTVESHSFVPSPSTPRLAHVTLTAFSSLLSAFSDTATTLEHLRQFHSGIFVKGSSQPISVCRLTRTFEAFMDAVGQEVRAFDSWCAAKEMDLCRAQAGIGLPFLVSLLGFQNDLQNTFSESFTALLDILLRVLKKTSRRQSNAKEISQLAHTKVQVQPSTVTCILLDILLEAMQSYSSMDDILTSNTLIRVFSKTAEPVWAMSGLWLVVGMPIRVSGERRDPSSDVALDNEFFIKVNDITLSETEFWADGYTLRGQSETDEEASDDRNAVPKFMQSVSEAVLASGKAVGLLRALGVPLLVEGMNNWRTFDAVLASSTAPSGFISTDVLNRVVYDEVLPLCQTADMSLAHIILDDCGFRQHLSAIEDVFLMRKGDAMSHYAGLLFAKMDSRQQWNDFHFLNSAFADVVKAQNARWVQTALVRIAYRGAKDKDRIASYTVRAIDGLSLEYAVPFPLTYIFTPRVLQSYSSIFVFLLQIHRAKSRLERFLLRGAITQRQQNKIGLKIFYSMRSRLSWFVNTLLNFLTTYVIHAEVIRFRKALESVDSLDSIIRLHHAHINKIQGRCLLQANTAALHRAIVSVLDMCLRFSNTFITLAGDTTHDVSSASVLLKRARGRRPRRRLRNVIGLSDPSPSAYATSSDETASDDDHETYSRGCSPSLSTPTAWTSTDTGVFDQLEKMVSELDGLVRFIRRGVESLAGGSRDSARAFEVLAFTMEDWDM